MRQDGVIPYFVIPSLFISAPPALPPPPPPSFYNEKLSYSVIAIEICESCLTFNENFPTL